MLIESRIVEASSNFNKALGVQWGGNATFSEATGNATGPTSRTTSGRPAASRTAPARAPPRRRSTR